MDTLFRDLRHAVRSLRRTPGFRIAALLILALGIGMSTAMFTVFKTVLVDRLPIRAQERVVIMHTLDRNGKNMDVPFPYLAEIRRDSALFNIGNLSLVRLLGRTREIAVRRAIGARSMDVVRLFAVENALLATLGGALGFLTAVTALGLVRAAAPPQVPRIDALGSLGAPLAAAVGITLLALLIFGILPSFVGSRIRSYAVLRSDSRSGTESRLARRARQWLVAMQIALAVVLLAGAGLYGVIAYRVTRRRREIGVCMALGAQSTDRGTCGW